MFLHGIVNTIKQNVPADEKITNKHMKVMHISDNWKNLKLSPSETHAHVYI